MIHSNGLRFFYTSVVLIFSIWTQAVQAQSIGFSISENATPANSSHITVNVLDDQTLAPIPNAKVSVTDSLGFFHVSERLRADHNGIAESGYLSPFPKTITVSQTGYATLSIIGVEGSAVTVYLRPLKKEVQTVVASATLTPWEGIGSDSGVVHAGLVFRTVSALDLLDFQISNFVSPLKDTLDLGSLAGSHEIPSNTVIPDQTVSYLFFNIELNKPTYRLPVPASENVGLTGVEVEGNIKDFTSLASNHQYSVDMLDLIRFKRVGFTQKSASDRDVQVDLNASLELSPQHTVSLSALPPFKADIVAASFMDEKGNKEALIPTDAKAIYNSQNAQASPRKVTLSSSKSITAEQRAVGTVAVGNKGTQLSGVLVYPAGSTVQTGQFLDTPALPQNQPMPVAVQMQAPSNGVGAAIFETDQPVWFVYSLPVAGTVQVPTAKLAATVKVQSYSVNQLEFTQFDPKAMDGTQILTRLQRFARSSAQIK